MVLTDISGQFILNANAVSLFFGIIITLLFYRQYMKYEHEIEREELMEQFLSN
jgi:hypothetical protein